MSVKRVKSYLLMWIPFAVLMGIRERKINKVLDVAGGLVYDLPVSKNSTVF